MYISIYWWDTLTGDCTQYYLWNTLAQKTIWIEGSIQDTVSVFFLPNSTCSEHVSWVWRMTANCRKTFSAPSSNMVGKSLILTVIHLTKICEPWFTANWNHCTAFDHTQWSKSGGVQTSYDERSHPFLWDGLSSCKMFMGVQTFYGKVPQL